MASTKIKYLDTNRNEVVKEASVVAAFNDSIVLEFGEVEGENKIVQVVYDTNTGTYQAVPEGSEKGSKWYESKDKLVKILRDQLPIEEYKEAAEVINITITREDKKIGHPLALREANYLAIKANYEKALATLRAPKVEETVAEIPKEETIAQDAPSIQPISEVVGISTDTPIADNQVNMTIDTSKMEDIKKEHIDVNNMIFTPREEEKKEENDVPVIEDVSKNEPILETPVSIPEPIPDSVPDPTPVPEVTPSIIPTAKNEEPSKIMEAIETPNEMLHEVNNMPPIVDAPKQDNNDKIVNFPGVTSENIIINNGVQEQNYQENKTESSAVKDSYLIRIEMLEQRAEKAKEDFIREINTSYDAYIKELKEIKKEIAENLTQSKMIRDSAEQTLRKAEEFQANNIIQMNEEQSLRRAA